MERQENETPKNNYSIGTLPMNTSYASNSITLGYNAVNNHEGCIVFNTGKTPHNTLEFRENGDIYVHGKLIENDKQIVEGFREFLHCMLKK